MSKYFLLGPIKSYDYYFDTITISDTKGTVQHEGSLRLLGDDIAHLKSAAGIDHANLVKAVREFLYGGEGVKAGAVSALERLAKAVETDEEIAKKLFCEGFWVNHPTPDMAYQVDKAAEAAARAKMDYADAIRGGFVGPEEYREKVLGIKPEPKPLSVVVDAVWKALFEDMEPHPWISVVDGIKYQSKYDCSKDVRKKWSKAAEESADGLLKKLDGWKSLATESLISQVRRTLHDEGSYISLMYGLHSHAEGHYTESGPQRSWAKECLERLENLRNALQVARGY